MLTICCFACFGDCLLVELEGLCVDCLSNSPSFWKGPVPVIRIVPSQCALGSVKRGAPGTQKLGGFLVVSLYINCVLSLIATGGPSPSVCRRIGFLSFFVCVQVLPALCADCWFATVSLALSNLLT